ncbi:MAG: methyltransferase domain-containing protein [Candidatus Aenigmarchaeota archaeon]|nr:methyltransferase domain-containing protein [Candidatus Aenigmarchaeota archaeon]
MTSVKQPRLPKQILSQLFKVYDEKADIYDTVSRYQDSKNDILKIILQEDVKGKVVLDMGAGTGRASIPLAVKAKKVYALDQSKSMLRILRKKIKAKKIKNISILKSPFKRIPIPSESVDLVVSVWSFPTHSKNWDRDLREVRRVLKKNGKILVFDTYHGGEYYRMRKKFHNPELFSSLENFKRDLRKWMVSRGFRYRILDVVADFRTKLNVERVCAHFFGYELATHMLARDKVIFGMKVFMFYGGKQSQRRA